MAAWKYKLEQELAHETVAEPVAKPAPAFDNAWLSIEPAGGGAVRLRVRAGYAWDGCTWAPDLSGTRLASCLHDAVSQCAEPIAAASGWSVRDVLRWGDRIFMERMRADGAARWVVWLYTLAVRLLGYAYHQAARWLRGR